MKGAGSQTPTQDDIVHPRRAEQSHHDGLKHPSHKRTRITSDNLPMSSRQSIPGPPAAYSKAILEQNQATTPLTPEELTAPSQEATIDEQPKPNTQIIEELSLGSPEQHEEASDDVHPIVSIGGSSANRLDFPLSHPNSSQSTAKLNSIDTKSTPATTLGSPNPLPAVMSTSFQFQSQLQQLSVPPPQGESDFLPVSNQPLSTLRNSSSSSLLSELSGAPSPTEATFSELANACVSSFISHIVQKENFLLLKFEPVSHPTSLLVPLNVPNQGAKTAVDFHAQFLDVLPYQMTFSQWMDINGVIFLKDFCQLAVVTFQVVSLAPSSE